MMVAASHAAASPQPVSSANTEPDPIHPITPQMQSETAAWSSRQASDFDLPDTDGKHWTLSSLSGGKPLYLYFILNGCVCSVAAEPHFQRLYQTYKGRIAFAAIIDADPAIAARWKKENGTPYTILSDKDRKAIHALGAKQAVYNMLILPGGRIDTLWPGYSQDMLMDINSHLAAALGIPPLPFDTKDAPMKKTSGCIFE